MKEVDSLLKASAANVEAEVEAEPDSDMTASLRQLFTAVDRDRCLLQRCVHAAPVCFPVHA